MASILKNTKGRKVLNLVTLKSVRTGFGHDRAGFDAKVYIGKTFIGTLTNDGWGGESQFDENVKGNKQILVDLLNKNNYKQIMFDNGWDFLDKVDNINDHDMIDSVVEENIKLSDIVKKIKSVSKRSLITGIPYDNRFMEYGWKNPWTLEKVVASNKALLEKLVEKTALGLVGDNKILNSNLHEFNLTLSDFAKSKIAPY